MHKACFNVKSIAILFSSIILGYIFGLIGISFDNYLRILSSEKARLYGWSGMFFLLFFVISLLINQVRKREQDLLKSNADLKNLTMEFAKQNNELKEISTRDPLTNLYNRRFVEENFSRLIIATAARNDDFIFLCYIDIDEFKSINDTFGHEAGDDVLKTVSKIILKAVRTNDFVSRWGGDEIIIIGTTETDHNEGTKLVERIQDAISSAYIFYKSTEIKISISIGISSRSAVENDVFQKLLNEAEENMYAEKFRKKQAK